jgi:hypothetical protein
MANKNSQRTIIKQALITGLLFDKAMKLMAAKKKDEVLSFPAHQLSIMANYDLLISNVTCTNAKHFKLNGKIDKRRQKRFGLKGKTYLVKPNV